MTLKRLVLLVLAIALVGSPVAEASASASGTAAEVAAKKGKKKKKKCKAKKKGKKGKKGKKVKCKKKRGSGGGGSQGLPGKPIGSEPSGPGDPDDPEARVLDSITLDENPLLAGTSGEGQVTISEAAPAGGQAVTLGSQDPSRALLPDAVHIAAGQTTADFQVDTTAGPGVSLTLTAATDASVRTTQLEIVEEADLDQLELDYQCFPDVNQSFAGNFVRLNVRAPVNTVVDLESSDPLSLEVPGTAVVPEGSFTGGFQVQTLLTTPSVTVTGTYDGVVMSDTASVRDSGSPLPVPTGMTLSPVSVVVGDPSTGRITLDCEAGPGGITVALSDDHPLVTTPSSVTIPEGQLSATFPIATDVSGSAGQAIITGDPPSGADVQATLELRDIGT